MWTTLNNIPVTTLGDILGRYIYLKNIAKVFAKPTEYFGKRVLQWQSQGIERRHALVFFV